MGKEASEDGDEGVVYEADDVASRQIVVATLNFLKAEIAANLRAESPGVASVLSLIETLADETQKPLTKSQIEKTKIPARMVALHLNALSAPQFIH